MSPHDEESAPLIEPARSTPVEGAERVPLQQEHGRPSRIYALLGAVSAIALIAVGLYGAKEKAAPVSADLRSSPSSASPTLKISIHRLAYEAVEATTAAAYGYDHFIEPSCQMVFDVLNGVKGYKYTWTVTEIETGEVVLEETTEAKAAGSLTVNAQVFTSANVKYIVKVQELASTEGAESQDHRSVASEKVITKYVRREFRDVNTKDMHRFLDALHVVFTTDQDEGIKKYGKEFRSHGHFAALHDNGVYKFHGALSFFTSHPAMILLMEKSVLSVDSGVIFPYWDFMQDAGLSVWTEAAIYADDLLGSVHNGPEAKFQPSGRWSDVAHVLDNKDEPVFAQAGHDAFGFLGHGPNNFDYLQRTNYYCGWYATDGFHSCADLSSCIDEWRDGGSFVNLDACVEYKVHGDIHSMHGGMWECKVDLDEVLTEHTWMDQTKISFLCNAIEEMVAHKMKDGTDFYNKPSDCALDSTFDECRVIPKLSSGIKSAEAIDSLDIDKVYEYIESPLDYIHAKSEKALNVPLVVWEDDGKDDDSGGSPGKYKFLGLTEEQNHIMYRLLLKLVAFPGKWAVMRTGAASADPLFWFIHQIFDKTLHAARLSPGIDDVSTKWQPYASDSDGKGFLAETPFKGRVFGLEDEDKSLTNKELWGMLAPTSSKLPYIYDKVFTLGSCYFDTDSFSLVVKGGSESES